jgi:hypothetical protein
MLFFGQKTTERALRLCVCALHVVFTCLLYFFNVSLQMHYNRGSNNAKNMKEKNKLLKRLKSVHLYLVLKSLVYMDI